MLSILASFACWALFSICQLSSTPPFFANAILAMPVDDHGHGHSAFVCPSKCECHQQGGSSIGNSIVGLSNEGDGEEEMEDHLGEEADSSSSFGYSIRCLRGSMNDSEFLALLQSLPTDVRQLEIRGAPGRPNSLHWSDNLNRLSRLRRLVLMDSRVPALSQAIRLPLLSELVLAGNEIEQIQLGSFLGMPMLETLDLSRNRIGALPTGAFIYLKNLRSLSLSHNRLGPQMNTGNMLSGPRRLKSLQLDGNRLSAKQLNDLFPDMAGLERLELNGCGLDDAQMWALNFSAVPELRRLGLAANNLTQMPSSSLRALASLHTLDFRQNLLRSVGPCAFCGLNITRLFLGHNLLGLSARPFHREAFAECHLLELDLGWNHFHKFDSSLLAGAQDWLEMLHLSGNPLEMDAPLIGTLPRLRQLHLAECHLGTVPYSLPKAYQQLELLNLSSNGLDNLPPNLGILMPRLQVLDISHNKFSSLPHPLVVFIDQHVPSVYLHQNPWDCECAAQPIQLHMLHRQGQGEQLHYEETVCAVPPLLRGQPLHRVQQINDCAVLFGANFGITQNMELILILGALLVAAFIFSLILLGLLYCGREASQKGTYLTGERRRQFAGNGKRKGLGGGGRGGANGGSLLMPTTNSNGRSSDASGLDLDLSPPPPLQMASSATNSSLLSSSIHGGGGMLPMPSLLSPLTLPELAEEHQQQQMHSHSHMLLDGPREKHAHAPLLLCPPNRVSASPSMMTDFNQNCMAPPQKAKLHVQSQGPRHPMPPNGGGGGANGKTLLTF